MPQPEIDIEVLKTQVASLQRELGAAKEDLAGLRKWAVVLAIAAAFSLGTLGFLEWSEIPRQAERMVSERLPAAIDIKIKEKGLDRIEYSIGDFQRQLEKLRPVAENLSGSLERFSQARMWDGEYRCTDAAVKDVEMWISSVGPSLFVGRTSTGQCLLSFRDSSTGLFDHFMTDKGGLTFQHRVRFTEEAGTRTMELLAAARPPRGEPDVVTQVWTLRSPKR